MSTGFTSLESHINSGSNSNNNEAFEGWSDQTAVATNVDTTPIVFSLGFGPLLALNPADLLIAPTSSGETPVVRFTVPEDGTYDLLAFWQDLDPNGGDGFAAAITLNGELVTESGSLPNGAGFSTVQSLSLRAGDRLDFIMGINAEWSFDTTKFDVSLVRVVPAQAANISTRAFVETGDRVAIAGFIVQDLHASRMPTRSVPPITKRLVIRGIGPSLASAGIVDTLEDPFLDLRDENGVSLATNDNWQSNNPSDLMELSDHGLEPDNATEAAIIATLGLGRHTAILRGANGETGTGLVEVYDIDPDSDAALANISTRAHVGTGDNVVIGGFILDNGGETEVVVRGMGPSLEQAGITEALADPELALVNGNGMVIAANNDWADSQQAAIDASGLAPGNSAESAILITLPLGAYTVILSGHNDTTGIGLVEVYNTR